MKSPLQGRVSARFILCGWLLAGLSATASGALAQQAALQVACAPERALVHPGETVRVNAWVTDAAGLPPGPAAQLGWRTDSGRLTDDNGDGAEWSLPAAPIVGGNAVTAQATVRARLGASVAECELRILIVAPPRTDDTRGPLPAARAFLLPQAAEPLGFGLTSYLLLKEPAQGDEELQRNLRAIEAVLRAMAPVEEFLEIPGIRAGQLHIVLLPVKRSPKLPASLTPANLTQAAQGVLDAYDYARAAVLLAALDDKADHPGPYLTSRPTTVTVARATRLFFDLGHVEPKLVGSWVGTYCALAGQQSSWSDVALAKLSLSTRNAIAVGARTTPDVVSSLEQWLRVLNPK